LPLRGTRAAFYDDVARYFADAALAKTCTTHTATDSGHGRIGERCIRVTGGTGWLKDLHPNWAGPRCIVAVTSVRTHKKSGATSKETRFYITSLPPDPEPILAAIRAHWGIENTLHWPLDVTFREDSSRLRKDNAAANMAVIRKAAFNALKRLPSKLSLKLRRVQASLDPAYHSALISS
jgi:predicted transposase YbfD/YdcC